MLEDLALLVDVVEVRSGRGRSLTVAKAFRVLAMSTPGAPRCRVSRHRALDCDASGWNEQHLGLLDRLCELRPPRWHSEHLGFTIVDDHYLGTVSAVPATMEAADLLVKRAEAIQRRYGIDFLLEHVASPFARPDEMSASFLTYVAWNSGCGLVLDLHNLECDADNGRLSVDEFLDELDLTLVKEIHMAGGMWRGGYHLDVTRSCRRLRRWRSSTRVLPRCPNVDLVVFEMVGAAFDAIERDELVATVQDLRRRIEVAGVVG